MNVVELGVGFLNDVEKLEDFFNMSREEFLSSYSYLSEDEYDITKDTIEWSKEMEIEENELTVVMWPYSQDYMEQEGVSLINDDVGLRLFGGSAYLVPDALLYTDEPFSIEEVA